MATPPNSSPPVGSTSPSPTSTTGSTTSPPPPPPPPPPSSTPSPTTSSPTPPPSSNNSPPPSNAGSGTPSTSSTTSSSTAVPSTTAPVATSTTPPLPTSTSPTPTTNTSASVNVTTIVSVVSVTPSRGVAPVTTSQASNSKSFFKNTGAVAGTFSVVGVVVLVLIVALITNGIRRRRARKFDREIEEAAAAAATATAPPFLVDDEEDDHFGRGGYGNRGYPTGGYSDASSHGTYGQPAMSVGHGQETYGMREIVHGPSPGEYYDSGYGGAAAAAGAGAAGVGVMRSRSTRDGSYATGLTDGSSPYPAFVAPSMPQPRVNQDGYDLAGGPVGGYRGPNNPDYLVDAAGAGGVAAAGLSRGQSQYNNQNNNRYQPQQDYANLGRNKSLGSGEGGYGSRQASPPTSGSISLDHNAAPAESYASHYQPGAYQSFAGGHGSQAAHQQEHEDIDDAYGGYVAEDSPPQHYPNPFGQSSPHSRHDEYEESSGDDDEHHGRRVLKVANE